MIPLSYPMMPTTEGLAIEPMQMKTFPQFPKLLKKLCNMNIIWHMK